MRKSNGLWKKTLISVICIAETFIMAGSMAACAVKNDGAPSQQGAAESNEAQQNTGQSGNEQISLDDAKNAALADAGVSTSDVTYTKEKLDYEDGIAVYDIEFFADGVEYEYEINAATGTVYSKSVEGLQTQAGDGNGENAGNSEAYIDADSAKTAALDHAGLTDKDVSNLKCEFDIEDGQAVYEINFYKDSTEYEYTVNAVDGTVVEYDVD